MTNLHHRSASRHAAPDLFDWLRERELRASNPAARKIAARYGVPIRVAAALARNAGLGSERCQ